MVLSRKKLCILIFFSIQISLHSQELESNELNKEADYAYSVIIQILKESPEGIILANEIDSMKLSFSQKEKYWTPSIQFDLSTNSNLVQGEYNYVKNAGIISAPQLILSPTINVNITQNLPGNGQILFNAGYSFSYLLSQNAFIQQPFMQVGVRQTLCKEAFVWKNDPSIQKLKNQKDMAELEFQEVQFELIRKFVNTVKNYDLSLLTKEYYAVVLKKIQAEYNEIDRRYNLGQKKEIELFNLNLKESEALQKLQEASLNMKQAKVALETYKEHDILENSSQFREGILILLNKEYNNILHQSLQECKIRYQIEDEKLTLQSNKSIFSPSVYVQISLTPNNDDDTLYVDFSRSLRDITDQSKIWSVTAAIGISIPIDNSSQIKTLNESFSNKNQNLILQLEGLNKEERYMQQIYNDWYNSLIEHNLYMKNALQKEEIFRINSKKLLENGIITESEYWESEEFYFKNRLNYYQNIWQIIQCDFYILNLSSEWIDFIQQFKEV